MDWIEDVSAAVLASAVRAAVVTRRLEAVRRGFVLALGGGFRELEAQLGGFVGEGKENGE
ncbi:hypothetical protein [Streptomyces sp. NPDC088925]|uniref:hypothetical protein n=1 Tax=Streptomyces sp. NPDC088925 TaxID=3365914 RepID=UPI00381CF54E